MVAIPPGNNCQYMSEEKYYRRLGRTGLKVSSIGLGTDNFANAGNIDGQLEAGKRADHAIGILNEFVARYPKSSLFITSDSDAGGLQIVDCGRSASNLYKLSRCEGRYQSAADNKGRTFRFNLLTTGTSDVAGGIVIRGSGKYGKLVKGTMDNTDIHTLLRSALFKK